MVGKTIAHYEITDKLGEAGMAVVYKAEDTKLRRTVALKFLSRRALGHEQVRARFVRKLRQPQSAKCAIIPAHPSMISVYALQQHHLMTAPDASFALEIP